MLTATRTSLFTPFRENIEHIELPKQFTFPFFYDPHPLSILAAIELQEFIENQCDWKHNFGLNPANQHRVIGKMFGVLVVQNQEGQLGYISAFSGKIDDSNHHKGFVPPVFDMLDEKSFFPDKMKELTGINSRIADLKNSPSLEERKLIFEQLKEESKVRIEAFREEMRQAKAKRKQRRTIGERELSQHDFVLLKQELSKESLMYKHRLRVLVDEWDYRLQKAQEDFEELNSVIEQLKVERKDKSWQLQQQLFNQYNFLNADGSMKNVCDLFEPTAQRVPPSGAGECAAPKLLQYAYHHKLKPIAMAEFWWGASPKSEIRKHKTFYPACRGKCEPILNHMLQGLNIEPNPMLLAPDTEKSIEIIFEDEDMLAINKPHEFLSVPGKTPLKSVYDFVREKYPEATGPLIVHRLDMATSGIMLIAKNREANKALQAQFIDRKIHKRYVALLDGVLRSDEGMIDLPLRIDLDDRPRQLVCYDYGKPAQTKWKVLKRKDGKTLVQFFPITGRTHQLRVHAAHTEGLDTPIVGDDLYGNRSSRLHLHAEFIEFEHPRTRQKMTLQVNPEFKI